MEIKEIVPSLAASYERMCHDVAVQSFMLPLRGAPDALRDALLEPRLQRAIGVIYRPQSERASHYFQTVLPDQFDEYIWFDRTNPVQPFATQELEDMPDTYPFGL
jgi:protein-L-isoaspartate(D-aspartate) O-methyltransferase